MSFEQFKVDGANRAIGVEQFAAGKSINAAKVLHALGAQPVAIGFLGGYSGQFIREEMDRIGVQHDFFEVKPATRTCVTVVDRTAGTATELIEEAAKVPDAVYAAVLEKLREHLVDAKALILSGTLPVGAPSDFYARCVAMSVEAGALVVVDAKGEALKRALTARPTVVKPNRGELEETMGMKIDSEESMKKSIHRLIEAGPRSVVVTAGAGETIASDGNSFWKISTPRVKVVSPIGSGDSFAAGLTAALVSGESLAQACRLGAACGAANAMSASAGEVHRGDVDALLSGITVTPF